MIAHRGASGCAPEHTPAAHFLAMQQGSDYMEPDLVMTKDGVLVARHENEIGASTDVAGHPCLAGRNLSETIDGARVTGWLNSRIELTGHNQAAWRTDRAQAGIGGCSGDIGVHAFNLLEYVTGRKVSALCAALSRVLPGRQLDDDCNFLLRLDNGTPGVLHASQIAAGERSRFELRVYGEHGCLRWSREDPKRLYLCWLNRPAETRIAGASGIMQAAGSPSALSGAKSPEGFLDGLANIYRDFAAVVRRRAAGETAAWSGTLCGIEDGVRRMMFIQRASDSSARSAWVGLQ